MNATMICKCCDQPSNGAWFEADGDVYAEPCAIKMARELGDDVEFRRIETAEQAAARQAWNAQGVGTN